MNPLRGALWIAGAAVAGFLLFWGFGVYGRAQDAKLVAWKIEMKAKDDSLRVAQKDARAADSAYRAQVPIYIAGRDRILRDTVRLASPEVRACYAAADKVISACETRHRTDSLVNVALSNKITLLEDKPSGIRRIQMYGEAMYDVTGAVPVIRAGATAKILGPVFLSGAVEYAAPPASESKPAFRALAGLRINF